MTNPTELIQLYILLSYEKLQRSTISQHQRPIEASLRNRLLVWRFLKKIENEPLPSITSEPDYSLTTDHTYANLDDNNNNSWLLDFNSNCDEDNGIDMEIESDLVNIVDNNNNNNNNSTCETMNIDQTSDMTFLLKRAIGAERRQKSSSDNFHFNDSNNSNPSQMSESNTFEETEQFFQDLCAELTNTTATLVSASNFPTTPEQTLIH